MQTFLGARELAYELAAGAAAEHGPQIGSSVDHTKTEILIGFGLAS
jgi:hypothetical protein